MCVEWQFAVTPAEWLDPAHSQYSEYQAAELAIQRLGVGFRGSLSYTVEDLTILA
ncbi:hypothetical protein [Paractinoplanes hotanensis]|uniref:Uncharacterized protein n=1 Tax=Paractinoplanes hotanensis TaxID=2906497 RepID=A0ABT0YE21_9ACTN|nr:hypothetical protein [Actinoplanes hotanensis]MCM4084291.1 hypothetical protein [Actinoplanes hotanensis]